MAQRPGRARSNDPFARAQNILQHGEASVRPPKRRPCNLSRKVNIYTPITGNSTDDQTRIHTFKDNIKTRHQDDDNGRSDYIRLKPFPLVTPTAYPPPAP